MYHYDEKHNEHNGFGGEGRGEEEGGPVGTPFPIISFYYSGQKVGTVYLVP